MNAGALLRDVIDEFYEPFRLNSSTKRAFEIRNVEDSRGTFLFVSEASELSATVMIRATLFHCSSLQSFDVASPYLLLF